MLFKCKNGLISRSNLTQAFSRYGKEERVNALENLVAKNLLSRQEFPKPGSKKIPVFYNTTAEGQQWLDEYNKNYPS